MLIGNRFVLIPGLVLALLAGMVWFAPGQLAQSTREWSRQVSAALISEDEQLRAQKLEWHREVLQERLQAKEEITRELILGHISFLEAAASFLHHNSQPVEFQAIYAPGQGKTLAERNCRQVISWVRAQEANAPALRRGFLADCLEADLDEMLRQSGGLHLPPYLH